MQSMDTALVWESAQTDEPGDQVADSRIRPGGAGALAYYLVGPNAGRASWHLELVYVNVEGGVLFGAFPDDAAAKACAQEYENAMTTTMTTTTWEPEVDGAGDTVSRDGPRRGFAAHVGTVRSWVRDARKHAGMTQQGLADRAGVTRRTVQNIEDETHVPSVAIALRIAGALRQPVEDLFSLAEGLEQRRPGR